jgi:hypothetical protein
VEYRGSYLIIMLEMFSIEVLPQWFTFAKHGICAEWWRDKTFLAVLSCWRHFGMHRAFFFSLWMTEQLWMRRVTAECFDSWGKPGYSLDRKLWAVIGSWETNRLCFGGTGVSVSLASSCKSGEFIFYSLFSWTYVAVITVKVTHASMLCIEYTSYFL